jgi:hypothetical protein
VRPEGADHQLRKIPPIELSIDLVADERSGPPQQSVPRINRLCRLESDAPDVMFSLPCFVRYRLGQSFHERIVMLEFTDRSLDALLLRAGVQTSRIAYDFR